LNSDIVIFENAINDFHDIAERNSNLVSQGKFYISGVEPTGIIELDIPTNDEYDRKLSDLLYDSNKQVILECSPFNSYYYADVLRSEKKALDNCAHNFDTGSYRLALRAAIKKRAKMEIDRDTEMCALVKDTALKNPGKKIFVERGVVHSGVYHSARRNGIESQAHFPRMPFRLDILNSVLRKEMYGFQISDSELLATCVDSGLFDYFLDLTGSVSQSSDRTIWAMDRLAQEDMLAALNFVREKRTLKREEEIVHLANFLTKTGKIGSIF
jgi:hypothetical protein